MIKVDYVKFIDNCKSGKSNKILEEYYCDESNELGGIGSEERNCPNGCQDETCV